jgi:hypothetical protein
LLFLVRDWASSSTVAFGEKGGDAYLASVFQVGVVVVLLR